MELLNQLSRERYVLPRLVDDQSSILGTHMVEGDSSLLKVVLLSSHGYVIVHTHMYLHTLHTQISKMG